MPRTGTTMLMHGLASELSIPRLEEAWRFNDPNIDYRATSNWVDGKNPGIVKILSDHVSHANLDDIIQRAQFDQVLITHRRNLTDCCVSHYFTIFYGYHFKRAPSESEWSPRAVPKEHVNHWLYYMLKPFHDTMNRWRDYQWNHPVYYYEDLTAGNDIDVMGRSINLNKTKQAFVASNFDYRQLCVNYQEVENYIQRNLDPC